MESTSVSPNQSGPTLTPPVFVKDTVKLGWLASASPHTIVAVVDHHGVPRELTLRVQAVGATVPHSVRTKPPPLPLAPFRGGAMQSEKKKAENA